MVKLTYCQFPVPIQLEIILLNCVCNCEMIRGTKEGESVIMKQEQLIHDMGMGESELKVERDRERTMVTELMK